MPPRKTAQTKKSFTSASVITESNKLDAKKLLFLRDRLQRALAEKATLEKDLKEHEAALASGALGKESRAITIELIAAHDRGIQASITLIDILMSAISNLALEFPEGDGEA